MKNLVNNCLLIALLFMMFTALIGFYGFGINDQELVNDAFNLSGISAAITVLIASVKHSLGF